MDMSMYSLETLHIEIVRTKRNIHSPKNSKQNLDWSNLKRFVMDISVYSLKTPLVEIVRT